MKCVLWKVLFPNDDDDDAYIEALIKVHWLRQRRFQNPLWTFVSTTNEINFCMDSQIMHLIEHIKWHGILSHLLPKKVDYFPSCVHSKAWNYFISNMAKNLVYIYITINFPKVTAKLNPITWHKMNMLFKDSLL
jgi:hypothetical protein